MRKEKRQVPAKAHAAACQARVKLLGLVRELRFHGHDRRQRVQRGFQEGKVARIGRGKEEI